MLDKLRSMAVFAKVVELGSFRRAAEVLGLSASVVSHHVAQLERQLGVTLLYRSTRHLSPTVDGAALYQSCREMVSAAQTGLDSLASGLRILGGRLWIVAPGPFSAGPFVDDVALFAAAHPQLQIRLDFDDRPRNVVQEGIDLAIRFGDQPDSSLVSRKLFDAQRRVFAAPDYLAANGTPRHPVDLANHAWIAISGDLPLDMTDGTQAVKSIATRSRIVTSSTQTAQLLAMRGLGLILLPVFVTHGDVAAGRLRPVLPEWESAGEGCYALYPQRVGPNAASRRFVDFLLERLALAAAVRDAG